MNSFRNVTLAATMLASVSFVVGEITGDIILPLFALAAGIAVAGVHLWNAPVRTQITFLTEQVNRLEGWLKREIDEHEKTREKVAIAHEALSEAGIRLKHLEDDGNAARNP